MKTVAVFLGVLAFLLPTIVYGGSGSWGKGSALSDARPQIFASCKELCSKKRLGDRIYEEACQWGCTNYLRLSMRYDKETSLSLCSMRCNSVSRNLCTYGCQAAQRDIPY